MTDLILLLIILGAIYYTKYTNEKQKQARRDTHFRATYRPTYKKYQIKSPDTIEVTKIDGEYDGSFNKEFEK